MDHSSARYSIEWWTPWLCPTFCSYYCRQ